MYKQHIRCLHSMDMRLLCFMGYIGRNENIRLSFFCKSHIFYVNAVIELPYFSISLAHKQELIAVSDTRTQIIHLASNKDK